MATQRKAWGTLVSEAQSVLLWVVRGWEGSALRGEGVWVNRGELLRDLVPDGDDFVHARVHRDVCGRTEDGDVIAEALLWYVVRVPVGMVAPYG